MTDCCRSACYLVTGGEMSRDKMIDFHRVLSDLPYGITIEVWAFPIYARLPFPFEPYIRFLFVRTSILLMASFRFVVTYNTLANRQYFLSTRRTQGLTPCQYITMPDIPKKGIPDLPECLYSTFLLTVFSNSPISLFQYQNI